MAFAANPRRYPSLPGLQHISAPFPTSMRLPAAKHLCSVLTIFAAPSSLLFIKTAIFKKTHSPTPYSVGGKAFQGCDMVCGREPFRHARFSLQSAPKPLLSQKGRVSNLECSLRFSCLFTLFVRVLGCKLWPWQVRSFSKWIRVYSKSVRPMYIETEPSTSQAQLRHVLQLLWV